MAKYGGSSPNEEHYYDGIQVHAKKMLVKIQRMMGHRLLKFNSIAAFALSICLGVFLGIAFYQNKLRSLSDRMVQFSGSLHSHRQLYLQWLHSKKASRMEDKSSVVVDKKRVISESRYLQEQTRVLCAVLLSDTSDAYKWISSLYMPDEYNPTMSMPQTAIGKTWGKHCSKLLFFAPLSYQLDMHSKFPVIRIPSTSYVDSWKAYRSTLTHIAKNYLNTFDWFLLAEDDTYVMVENLGYFLAVHNASALHYFGHSYERWGSSFNKAGAGSVMSKAALRKLYSHLAKGHCEEGMMAGEVVLGMCLSDIGVSVADTRDHRGRARFLNFQPETHLVPGSLPWTHSFWTQSRYLSAEEMGIMCLRQTTTSV